MLATFEDIEDIKSIREVEKDLILAALEHYQNDKKLVAKKLGMSLKTLYNRLNEYGVKVKQPRPLTLEEHKLGLREFYTNNPHVPCECCGRVESQGEGNASK